MTDANETMNELHQLFFIEQGIALNKNGGYYQRGRSYGIEKKLLVAATYLDAKEICGTRPNITHIARQCRENGQAWDHWMGDRGLPTERHDSSVCSSLELDHFCSSCSLFCDASSCCSSLSLTGCSHCRSSYYYLSCCSGLLKLLTMFSWAADSSSDGDRRVSDDDERGDKPPLGTRPRQET